MRIFPGDNIAYYTDKEIGDWLKRFNESPADVLIISDIPFSYYEIRNEYIRRENCKAVLEELKP